MLILYAVSTGNILTSEANHLRHGNQLIPSGRQFRNNGLAGLSRRKVQSMHQHNVSILYLTQNNLLGFFRIPRTPVLRINRPKNQRFTYCCFHIRRVISPGKTYQCRNNAGSILNRLIRLIELISNIVHTFFTQMNIMIIGVISHLMTTLHSVFNILRKLFHSLSHNKEGRSSIHLLQLIHQNAVHLHIRSVIKGQSHHGFARVDISSAG